jgi:uncharacterized protein
MKTKKIPMRKCIGCMESFPKKELCRIVKNKENEVKLDLTGKVNGRGIYICKNADCFEKAIKTKRLAKSLEMEIPENIYEEIKQEISKHE